MDGLNVFLEDPLGEGSSLGGKGAERSGGGIHDSVDPRNMFE